MGVEFDQQDPGDADLDVERRIAVDDKTIAAVSEVYRMRTRSTLGATIQMARR